MKRTSLDSPSDEEEDEDEEDEDEGLSSIAPPAHRGSGDEDDEEGGTAAKKNRWRSLLLPQAWGNVLHKLGRGGDDAESPTQGSSGAAGAGGVHILPNGTRVSPPVSPLQQRRAAWDSGNPPLLPPDHLLLLQPPSELSSLGPAELYAEKLQVYNMKYSYLKAWPGLLRLLAGLELLFGGMVFACVCAYVQKDGQWASAYGALSNGLYGNGLAAGSGFYYGGPMTPFVLAVVGLSWVVTLVLLVLGLTLYYRSILLDAPWWPLTEGLVNVALFLLYMAAGVVYLNDLNRGGLCSASATFGGVNPVMAGLCRVDGGQMAGAAFVFITMAMYLVGFLVCLKMWRREAARREREEERHHHGPAPTQPRPRMIGCEDDEVTERPGRSGRAADEAGGKPGQQGAGGGPNMATPTATPGHAPKPRVLVAPDYALKYPELSCVEDRESYRAVFNDQYQEYRELHAHVSSALRRVTHMDAMMDRLLQEDSSQGEKKRINELLKRYEQKKSDAAFLEKKERCDYLKAKLSHIKSRIRDFDQSGAAGRRA